jgi:peptidoglycan/LPS O-acetylase OafA/YrhL
MKRLSSESAFYLPELDLLRFFAFILVFLSHSVSGNESFYSELKIPLPIAKCIIALAAGGTWGVDLFFALSAYLITSLLLREQATYGSISVRAFYARRSLRIWPLYFGFLLIGIPILRWVGIGDMPLPYKVAFLLFLGNWSCTWWGYPHTVATPLWSVSIEEQFYLIWPLLTCRWRTALGTVIAVMFGIAIGTRAWLAAEGIEHPGIWCNTFARLDPIAAGALLAWLTQYRRLHLRGWLRVLLFLAAMIVLAVLGHFDAFVGIGAQLAYPAATLACAAMLMATIGVRVHTDSRLIRWGCHLGRISYGLYVFHVTSLTITAVADAPNMITRLVRTAGAFAMTVMIAALSYRFVERPFLKLKASAATRITSAPT